MGAAIKFPPLDIPLLLRKYGLDPKKGLGQNFLVDENFLEQIVMVAEIQGEDIVLEVGAGAGNLTRWLAQAAQQVVAVEKDVQLIPVIKEVIGTNAKIHLVAGDILELDPGKLMNRNGYIVAANIPYYITSALFRHLLEASCKPKRMVLTIQQEVAQRICANPGELSLLALSVQVYGKPQTMFEIPASAFYPIPRVDSAVLRVELYSQPLIPTELLNDFFRLIKAGFSQKRKMLHNALSAGLAWSKDDADAMLKQSGVDPHRRAQTLSIEDWHRLTENYRSKNMKVK
jgi:16S rRNA (adenine1518-N6/adenine1519-N6)-dimethyltransferase